MTQLAILPARSGWTFILARFRSSVTEKANKDKETLKGCVGLDVRSIVSKFQVTATDSEGSTAAWANNQDHRGSPGSLEHT